MRESGPIWLEDLAVGMEFRSGEHRFEVADIQAFAAKYDPQPFHLDPVAAEQSFFQGLAASGWHTAAESMRLMVESLPVGCGLIGVHCDLGWPRPTRPGDTVRVVSRILEIQPSKSKPDRGIVTVECLTYNQADEICQRLVTKLLVMRKTMPTQG